MTRLIGMGTISGDDAIRNHFNSESTDLSTMKQKNMPVYLPFLHIYTCWTHINKDMLHLLLCDFKVSNCHEDEVLFFEDV